ncbi:double-strand break repair helicase AddA [Niveispirillum lacus]|uniref:DNA 3'-5' helicase n=1 Tax=Niveispirillum lacus TaxID=1981099 RepID=A0A255Z1C2_9PROT|nr:double-strand break repair helicase AddA [Niveispirillum lacus]OYQ35268.1 double-strand break repair helicase AddA [Niveispirillum lacus]
MTDTRPIDPNVLQRLASDPESSVWVGASAGTGKTKVLTDRVLRLMLAGTDPSRILCLTFTKAAAAEMANRIADRLSVWAVADEERLRTNLHALTGREASRAEVVAARRLFARVLDTAGGMKIQTIHAFCQSLLRRFPLEAGLSPNFEVMDDRTAEELLSEAKQSVLLSGRYEPDCILASAVELLAGSVSEDEFNDLLASLTAERGRLRRNLEAQGGLENAIAALRIALGVADGDTDLTVLSRACASTAVDEVGLRRACAALATGTKGDIERGISLQAWLDASPSQRLRNWADYLSLFITGTGEPRKVLMTKKPSEADPMALEILQREAARLTAVTEERRRVAVASHTAALLTLGEALLDRYQRLKDGRGVLDFDDLILAASSLLSGGAAGEACAWVLFKLDGGLDHVLIDEAQDTNPEQWAVVSAIAEEFFAGLGARDDRMRSLFVVGDDKQSIFSFQRADPAEFARMRSHFDAKVNQALRTWRIIDLQTSFRSVGAVLAAVDKIFAAGLARDGVAAPDTEVRHIPHRRGMAGRVEIWPLVSPQDTADPDPWSLPLVPEQADKPVARLARTMADQIARWLADGERLIARNRPLRPGDIMVLVRSRDQFVGHLVRALKDRAVPVAGVDRMVLTEQLAVMDLMALARFLVLPEDDLNLAVLLKSPLLGVSEEQLFQVAHGRPGRLWAALTERAKQDQSLAPAWDYLRAILNDTDYRAPYELFAGVLSRPCPADTRGSGRRAILARLGAEAQDPLEEFLNACLLFEREHVASLQGFLHWLEASEAEIKRELDTGGGDGPGQVRIMTVHGSKGLQAPIVFLPDTVREPDKSPKVLWPEKPLAGEGLVDPGPALPLYVPRRGMEDRIAGARRAIANRRRDQEYRRLLYVALTRAEDRLIVCGWEQQRKTGGAGSWYRLIEAALDGLARPTPFDFTGLSPAGWAGNGLVLQEEQTVPVPAAPPVVAEVVAGITVPSWAVAPAPKEASPSKPLAPSQPDAPEPAMRSPLGGDDGLRFKRGNLIHTLLQVLPETDPARWSAVAAAWLARPAHNLTLTQQEEIAAEALRVLTDPVFAPLFAPGSRAEVPLVGLVGDRALSGRIDRLCVTGDAVWIVDYKTNRPPPREVEKVPAIYVQQMAAYRAALSRIYPGKRVRCVLLWTDGPFTMELPDGLLDRFSP